MKEKLILAAVLSLGVGSVAFAQTPSTSNPSAPVGASAQTDNLESQGPGADYPSEWKGDLASALFSDEHTLRSEAEIRTNWPKLSAEQQAQVQTQCDTMTTASVGGQNTAGADSNPTVQASSSSGQGGPNNAGGQAPGTQPATMAELCGVIKGM